MPDSCDRYYQPIGACVDTLASPPHASANFMDFQRVSQLAEHLTETRSRGLRSS
jgi:hypothetical protein